MGEKSQVEETLREVEVYPVRVSLDLMVTGEGDNIYFFSVEADPEIGEEKAQEIRELLARRQGQRLYCKIGFNE